MGPATVIGFPSIPQILISNTSIVEESWHVVAVRKTMIMSIVGADFM
jgi:hypothetical protein